METFGEWLRQQRERRNLSRKEFASRVGCSIALLRKIEDGERRPSAQIADLIANSLDIPPDNRATFVKVARGELSVDRLPAMPAPDATQPAPQANLPVLPTPLIGRQQEVEELSRLLHDAQCRLLTLVGPGGIGKTRLAIAAAQHVQDRFAGGVFFVSFTPVNTTRFILPMIADALGFAFESTSRADPKTQLLHYLKEKQVLLIIDNLEHLLAGPGIEVLADLLAAALQVKLLATSRESLGLQEEWVFDVQGLPVPDSQYVEGNSAGTAVELFLQRARRVDVGFNATPADYPTIVRICNLVGGMPLGIELAAAWVRVLSCEEIAVEIEHGLDILHGSARDLPARHRSMRAVFDHSWKLLAEEEQDILRRLSVFHGGFGREAAEAVAGAALSALSGLVTKSFLRRSGTGRYDLHELIRQFAVEQLAGCPEVQAEAQERHTRYYLSFFSQEDSRLRSADQFAALAALAVEMDNFRAAWDWAVAHDQFGLIEPALRPFAIFTDIRGWYWEGLDLLDRAILLLESAGHQVALSRMEQVTLAHLLTCQGLFALRLARHDQARSALERSLEILRPLREPRVLVEALTFLGLVMGLTGSFARASALYAEGLEIATAIGDRWFAALCRISQIDLGEFIQASIGPENAYQQFESIMVELRNIGDPRFIAIGLNGLSMSAIFLKRYDDARRALEESVALLRSAGDRWGLGFAYRGLGFIAQSQGEHAQAVKMFRRSLDTLTDLGARQDAARVLAEMGRSIFALGDDAEAGRLWREALRIAMEMGAAFIALDALVGLAGLLAKQGQKEQALLYVSIVLDHPETVMVTRDNANHLRAELEEQMVDQQIERAVTQARQTTFESAVVNILSETKRASSQ